MTMSTNRTFNLQDRLEDFAVLVIRASEGMPSTQAGRLLSDQLLRAGTSPALHYGEAQGAESKRDFVHKMKVALKELRESHAALRIIQKAGLLQDSGLLENVRKECSEMVAISKRV